MAEKNLKDHMLPAFSTPIFNDQLEDYAALNHELKALVEQEIETSNGLVKSYVGGWHSGEGFINRPEPAISRLRDEVRQRLTALTQSVLRPEFASQPLEFNLIGWANYLRHGQYNSLHCHPNAFWSGVYYVSANEQLEQHPFSGKLEFLDPCPGTSLNYSDKTSLYNRFVINPQPGQIIIFASWLQHQVHPYFGTRERISIAFNASF